MSDFCKSCSIELFGFDSKDLANLGNLKPGIGFVVICKGCGLILVDVEGNCILCELKPGQKGHGPSIKEG